MKGVRGNLIISLAAICFLGCGSGGQITSTGSSSANLIVSISLQSIPVDAQGVFIRLTTSTGINLDSNFVDLDQIGQVPITFGSNAAPIPTGLTTFQCFVREANGFERVVGQISEVFTGRGTTQVVVPCGEIEFPSVAITPASASIVGPSFGAETPDSAVTQLLVSRTGGLTDDLEVGILLAGTAVLGEDYMIEGLTEGNTSVVIPPGSVSAAITITALADQDNDEDIEEIISLTIVEDPNTYTVGTPSASTITITQLPIVTASPPNATISEPQGEDIPAVVPLEPTPTPLFQTPTSTTVFINRDGGSDLFTDLEVEISLSGTATLNSDFVTDPQLSEGNNVITIPVGSSSRDILIIALPDQDFEEGEEEVIISLQQGPAYSIGNPVTSQIVIQDSPCITIAPNDDTEWIYSAETDFAFISTGFIEISTPFSNELLVNQDNCIVTFSGFFNLSSGPGTGQIDGRSLEVIMPLEVAEGQAILRGEISPDAQSISGVMTVLPPLDDDVEIDFTLTLSSN